MRRRPDRIEVTLPVNGLAVFIGTEIDREIDWLIASCAGDFGERVTTHDCLLRTVTSRVFPERANN